MNKKIIALALFLSSNSYFNTFCTSGVGLYTEAGTERVYIDDGSFVGHAMGIELHGDGHSCDDCDFTANDMGLMLAADNSTVKNCVAQINTNQGIINMGDKNQLFGNSISANNIGIENAGSNLTAYDNFVQNNVSGNLMGTEPSDYLSGFEGTFTCLAVLKDIVSDTLDTVTLCCPCDFFITQNDIQNGLPYTISKPGLYCLAESVVGIGGGGNDYAISIESDDVVLDLQNHMISGQGINVNTISTLNNIVIRNGSIKNASGIGLLLSDCSNVTIDNISVISSFDVSFVLQNSTGLRIQNCVISSPSVTAFDIANVNDSSFVNIKVVETQGGMASNSASKNNIYDSCIVYNNAGQASFNISERSSVLRSCAAFSDLGNAGFFITANSKEITLEKCLTQDCSNNGFLITGTNSVLIDCSAIGNTFDGFLINAPHTILRSCIAEKNDTGFEFTTSTTGCKILSCCAIDNVDGFNDNNLGGGANYYFNNVAYNTTTDYINVTIAPVLSAGAISATNGNYWMNIGT